MPLQPAKTRKNRLLDAEITEKLRKGLGFKSVSSAELTTTCTKKTLDDPFFGDTAKGMDIILHTHHTLASDSFASQHTLHTVLPNSLVCFSPVSRRFQRTTHTVLHTSRIRIPVPPYLNGFEAKLPLLHGPHTLHTLVSNS